MKFIIKTVVVFIFFTGCICAQETETCSYDNFMSFSFHGKSSVESREELISIYKDSERFNRLLEKVKVGNENTLKIVFAIYSNVAIASDMNKIRRKILHTYFPMATDVLGDLGVECKHWGPEETFFIMQLLTDGCKVPIMMGGVEYPEDLFEKPYALVLMLRICFLDDFQSNIVKQVEALKSANSPCVWYMFDALNVFSFFYNDPVGRETKEEFEKRGFEGIRSKDVERFLRSEFSKNTLNNFHDEMIRLAENGFYFSYIEAASALEKRGLFDDAAYFSYLALRPPHSLANMFWHSVLGRRWICERSIKLAELLVKSRRYKEAIQVVDYCLFRLDGYEGERKEFLEKATWNPLLIKAVYEAKGGDAMEIGVDNGGSTVLDVFESRFFERGTMLSDKIIFTKE